MNPNFPYMKILALLLFLPFCWLKAGAADMPTAEEVRKHLSECLDARRIQTEFPRRAARQGEGRIGRGEPRGGAVISADSAAFLLWVAVAALAVIVFLTLRDHRKPERQAATGKSGADATEAMATAERMDTIRQQSETLAAAGDYAGAMHVLLLQSLEEMRRRLRVSMGVSLTSREILERIRLQPEAHASLGDIVARVEISWFGSHQPDVREYEGCLASFTALTRILGGGAAA